MRTAPALSETAINLPSRRYLRSSLKPRTSVYHMALRSRFCTVKEASRLSPCNCSAELLDIKNPPRPKSDDGRADNTRRVSALPSSLFGRGDRKSTRLNSSHQIISYAVFCLKKKIHK